MNLRGARVLARASDDGELVVGQDGRVEVRYKPTDTRAYRAAKRNLEPVAGEALLPDDACPEAAAADKPVDKKAAAAERLKKREYPPGAIIVYADGACSGNPGPA